MRPVLVRIRGRVIAWLPAAATWDDGDGSAAAPVWGTWGCTWGIVSGPGVLGVISSKSSSTFTILCWDTTGGAVQRGLAMGSVGGLGCGSGWGFWAEASEGAGAGVVLGDAVAVGDMGGA